MPISIEGKNILLYGENGSGKSSIYWALYTLLECANKQRTSEIQKYFDTKNEASLVNIYAPKNAQGISDSFVKISLLDGQIFEISYNDTSINTNQDAKISNYVSDFLSYRLLQRTHNVKHSSEIDIFPVFEDTVLSYLQFAPVNWLYPDTAATVQVINAGEMWNIIKSGPQKSYPRKNGNRDSYPLKSRHKAAYNEFKGVVEGFNNGLLSTIGAINQKANPILQNKLKYNISFHLEVIKKEDFETSENQYHQPKYTIKLIIDDFNHKGAVVVKPQSFLNEAILSAISLSIRLAILELRLPDSLIKILVLDDLLVSLDMTNRDRVTKLILNDYAWWNDDTEQNPLRQDKGHQTFIFTHDRSYFTFVKHEIDNLPTHKKNNWKIIEMYTDDIDEKIPDDFEKPRIFDYENELMTAIKHYRNHDYPSAANYFRKYSENILEWLPDYCWKDINKKNKDSAKMNLGNIIDSGISFWNSFGIDVLEYKELRKFVGILLNPLSHADVGVERYKEEIKQVDTLLKAIDKLHSNSSYKSLVSGGELIQIRIYNQPTIQTFVAEYLLTSSFYHIVKGSVPEFSSFSGELKRVFAIKDDGSITDDHLLNGNNKNMHENYTEFCSKPGIKLPIVQDWHKFLYKVDGTQVITLV